MKIITRLSLVGLLVTAASFADGPEDNKAENVRRIPPLGVVVSDADRADLEQQLDSLQARIDALKQHPLIPDVGVFHKAVRDCLRHQEFQKDTELKWAREQLALGMERAEQLAAGKAPWLQQHGLIVRGYRSRIDGSVQPYGLVVPDSYVFAGAQRHRLDFWFHGRGERTTEVAFIRERMTKPGQYTPSDTFVLHPYARFSNANKFAGEVDCLEALEHVQQAYRVDENRINVRGFSMGGAACWQFAVHYADRWAAANPGAGFAETREFLKSFQGEDVSNAPVYEQKLWHLYDCTDYALNLYNLPTIAYSGEIDRQKQAADVMAEALALEGIQLTHLIGPQTAHKIHPDTALEIEARMAALNEVGRNPFPSQVKLTTYTLRYNRMHWMTIDRLGTHWDKAVVEAEIQPGANRVTVTRIENVDAFTIAIPPGRYPFARPNWSVAIGDQLLESPSPMQSDRSCTAPFKRTDRGWQAVTASLPTTGAKRHGLQGPIDDAFMDSFLFVTPSAAEPTPWTTSELAYAQTHWRQQFRGDARVKSDAEVNDEDLRAHNLVLWGTPSSNRLIAQIQDQLPIRWDGEKITVGERSWSAADHTLIMIYPNPLNPERYVVLNSGFTYREYDYLNNARQIPKLPDWAVIDHREPATSRVPGKIVAAGFFDEHWQLAR